MATAFPFNQLPKIPGKVISQLLPPIFELQSKMLEVSNDLANKVSSLPNNVKCSDPKVTTIKNTLNNLEQLIATTQQITTIIPQISSAFGTFASIGQTISSIQLIIPMAPGVPIGPVTQTLQSATELVNNAQSGVTSINNSTSGFSAITARINSVINTTQEKITALCGGGNNNTDLSDTNTSLNDLYPSNFYNELNVIQSDIEQRIVAIQELLDSGLSVIDNINEAPSGVIINAFAPSADIGQIGDYYIDTQAEKVYGPKAVEGWNTGINY